MRSVQVDFLGEFAVRVGGRAIEFPAGKQRLLIVSLALRRGQTVPAERLLLDMWGEEPPPSAVTTLRGHVRRARCALSKGGAEGVVETVRGGCRLAAVETDLSIFRQKCDAARLATDQVVELREIERALDLWRGRAFQDLEEREWLTEAAVTIEEERLQAVERHLDLLMSKGDPRSVIRLAGGFQSDHPIRESLWKRLMLALHADGRTAEALLRYAELRELLSEQLGVEPSPPMRALHQQLLVAQVDSDSAAVGSGPALACPVSSPRYDTDVRAPIGREEEIEALDTLLADPYRPVALVLDGPAGVGKTSIAKYWVQTIRFEGGIVEVSLGAVHGSESPTTGAALAELLHALGVPRDEIPESTEARRQRFVHETSRLRVVVLLDDAASSSQVRPLLPGSGSLAVITSRARLSGLVLDDTARRLSVARLDADAGADLLRAVGGPIVRDAESATLRDLSRCCEGLPLALRIAAEVLDRAPGACVRGLVDSLQRDGESLDLLDLGDEALSVRAVLGLNRRLLGSAETALLVQIARSGMIEFDLEDVRRLNLGTGTSIRTILNRLVAVNILEQRGFGQFRLGVLHQAAAAGSVSGRSDGAWNHAAPAGF